MKVNMIISTIRTYNEFNNRLKSLVNEQIKADAFDDDTTKEEIQKEIDKTNEELGNFLNMEIR